MEFWILAVAIAAATIAILAYALIKGRGQGASTSDYDVQVYRDQLKELDRDLARGVVGAEEADRTRVEISRRLLEADRKAQAGESGEQAPKELTLATIGFVIVVVLGGSLWLYRDMGAPGLPDRPMQARIDEAQERRENRPSQAEAEAQQPDWSGPPANAPQDYLDLIDKLRTAVAERPDDLQGQSLLASHETALGNYLGAEAAMAQVLDLKGDSATAGDYSQFADILVMAAGGYVSPEAEGAINLAMSLDPTDGVARYYAGMMYAQTGRPDLAFRIWRDLLESSQPGAPWVAAITGQIEQLAAMAGVDYTPPAVAGPMAEGRGPSAEDMAAAQEMSAEDRAAMIEGMVTQLEDRLTTDGGTAAEWAKLINALGVMGNSDHAAEIWAEAQQVFAGDEAALAMLRQAVSSAGALE
ncbi:MAG: c-type cytochrome biogenesis protein CcmI [Maritimibacter sp.]